MKKMSMRNELAMLRHYLVIAACFLAEETDSSLLIDGKGALQFKEEIRAFIQAHPSREVGKWA